MIPIYHGFDGLEFAINVAIPGELSTMLSDAQSVAKKADAPALLIFGTHWLDVHATGARGGYAFRCTDRKTGEWFFKKPLAKDPWGVRFSAASHALAMHGLEVVRQMCKDLLASMGIDAPENAFCPSRIDFAVDFMAPDFAPNPDLFVIHSNSSLRTIAEIPTIDVHMRSNRITSVTVGKMPGRQAIIYDKTHEVIVHRKHEWFSIWDKRMADLGLTQEPTRIWRVEIRAAKRHLKDVWDVTGWASLYELLPRILQELLSDLRYCEVSRDSNRSRWEQHPLWRQVGDIVQTQLFEHVPNLSPDEYEEVKREQKVYELGRQAIGLMVSMAAIKGVSLETFEDHLLGFAHFANQELTYDSVSLETKLAKAREKYRHLV